MKRALESPSVNSPLPAKRQLVAENGGGGCSMNPAYSDNALQGKLEAAWRGQETLYDDSTGTQLLTNPFQCCVLPNFVSQAPVAIETDSSSGDFLESLRDELLKLKMYEKNNDLYQFHQSDDLKKFGKHKCISAFKSVLRDECLPWLRSVTGLELTDTIDVTCSKYEYTDVLLCHDDELEGRRIAFIFYLVPEWTEADGGCLDLFNVNDEGQPWSVVKSLLPVWNNFVFFDVNAVSFHQVSEVVHPSKTRLSINGWFHGPPPTRPPPYKEIVRPLHPPHSMDLALLSDWINPLYLDVGVQSQIQAQFEEDSQIQLPDFILEDKYSQLCTEMCSCDSTIIGQPNKRQVHQVSTEGLDLCKQLVDVVQSEPFCLFLSHLTGLDLAKNVIRNADSAKDSQCCSDAGPSNAKDSSKSEASKDSLPQQVYSSSKSQLLKATDSQQAEKQDINGSPQDETQGVNDTQQGDKQGVNDSSLNGKEGVALCRCDVYSWCHGDYSLASDGADPGADRFALDAIIYCCSEEWSPDYGGVISYIMKDADEELLSICPQPNTLSLVYRDKDTLSFTKYVNDRCSGAAWLNTVHGTYVENTP